jgi:muramidase (phage lysozyme)
VIIPPPAHEILTLIRVTETGRADATAYDVIFGHNEGKLTKPITEMTLDELQRHQPGFTKAFGSSASGAYQHMYATLKDQIKQLGLSGEEIFNAHLQDDLGFELLKRRGYERWIEGKISTDTFMIGLAREWASFPVPSRMKGAHRTVERGQSYYAGDGLNKALVGPDIVWLACEAARQAETVTPAPEVPAKPEVPIEPGPMPGFDVVNLTITRSSPNVHVTITLDGEVIVAGPG